MVKFIIVLALDVVTAFTADKELLLVPKDVAQLPFNGNFLWDIIVKHNNTTILHSRVL